MEGHTMDKISNERHSTAYPGVYFRIRDRVGGTGPERVYYVKYKKGRKDIEVKAGRQYADNMTAAKANNLRSDYIEGRRLTPQAIREEAKKKIYTVVDIWEAYSETLKDGTAKKTDGYRFKKYLMDQIGGKAPDQLLELDIRRIKNLLSEKSPQTTRHVFTLLKRIVNYGITKNLCKPMILSLPKISVNNQITEDLSPDELNRLLNVLDFFENRDVCNLLKMALLTGMRRGELFKLKWDDVDFNRKFIAITESKGGKDSIIPLNHEAEKLLLSIHRLPLSPFVFPGIGGRQRVDINRAARQIRDLAGLPKNFRMCHGLRHVYASMLASSGDVDLYTLQKLLTHKSPVMTQRYAHLRDEVLKSASQVAGNIIKTAQNENTEIKNTKNA
jgi:integrase